MRGIKAFVVLTVTAFYFAIVPWCKRTDKLVANPMCQQMNLKHCRLIPLCGEAVGKFSPVIRLNTFDRIGESLYQMVQKLSRRVGTVFVKSLYETPSGEFIQSSVLEELFVFDIAVEQTRSRNELDIDLNALPGMIHLLVRLRDILGIGRMNGHNPLPFQNAVECGDRA